MTPYKKTILINATAAVSGGALSILKQFLTEAKNQSFEFIIFNSLNNIPKEFESNNIKFINPNMKSPLKRIYWDFFGLNKYIEINKIDPTLYVSLQNTASYINKNIPKIIYLHQSLPIYNKKWSLFKKKERSFWLYKHIYPFFMRLFINKDVYFVCQGEWMRELYSELLKKNKEDFYVFKPKITYSTNVCPPEKNAQLSVLFYPANAIEYKNHNMLIKALSIVKKNIKTTIKVIFTIDKHDVNLNKLIASYGLTDIIILTGTLSQNDVYDCYTKSKVILFPSYIETFGLPLLEAAQLGKHIICSDLPYAHEVLQSYPGVDYVSPFDEILWAQKITQTILLNTYNYRPYQPTWPTWPEFFIFIKKIALSKGH